MALALLPVAGTAADPKKPVVSKKPAASKTAKPAKVQTREMARVKRDVHRLESLLAGVKSGGKVSDKSLKSVANEADTLANRIYANVQSAKAEKRAMRAAQELRSQVREMKKQAHQGDHKRTAAMPSGRCPWPTVWKSGPAELDRGGLQLEIEGAPSRCAFCFPAVMEKVRTAALQDSVAAERSCRRSPR